MIYWKQSSKSTEMAVLKKFVKSFWHMIFSLTK